MLPGGGMDPYIRYRGARLGMAEWLNVLLAGDHSMRVRLRVHRNLGGL